MRGSGCGRVVLVHKGTSHLTAPRGCGPPRLSLVIVHSIICLPGFGPVDVRRATLSMRKRCRTIREWEARDKFMASSSVPSNMAAAPCWYLLPLPCFLFYFYHSELPGVHLILVFITEDLQL